MDDVLDILYDRYAQALYEIADHNDVADRVMLELESVGDLWISDKHFKIFLTHPFVSHEEKKSVMEHIFGKAHYSSLVINLIKALIDNNRSDLIYGIFLKYRDLYESGENSVRVFVESPQLISQKVT